MCIISNSRFLLHFPKVTLILCAGTYSKTTFLDAFYIGGMLFSTFKSHIFRLNLSSRNQYNSLIFTTNWLTSIKNDTSTLRHAFTDAHVGTPFFAVLHFLFFVWFWHFTASSKWKMHDAHVSSLLYFLEYCVLIYSHKSGEKKNCNLSYWFHAHLLCNLLSDSHLPRSHLRSILFELRKK